MAGTAASLASALAAGLAAAVPPRARVTAEGSSLAVTVDDGAPLSIGIGEIIAQTGEPLENVRLAAYAVLSGVQDHIVEATAEQWPASLSKQRALALPGVTIEDHRLMLWYGDPSAPTLKLEPLSVEELGLRTRS